MKHVFIIIYLAIVFFAGCNSDPESCFKGNGYVVKEQREIKDFSVISVNDLFVVKLYQDTVNKLFLKGPENLLQYVEIRHIEDTLLMSNTATCSWAREYEKITAIVHVDSLEQVGLKKPSDLISMNRIHSPKLIIWGINDLHYVNLEVDCDQIYFKTSYSTTGEFIFRGKTNYAHFWLYYASRVIADSLKAERVKVLHHSIGNVHVYAEKIVAAEIYSKGNVYYSGNPENVICDDESHCFEKNN
ncbi:MAG: GIN domain-containing protein [Bacteroidota bacterium]